MRERVSIDNIDRSSQDLFSWSNGRIVLFLERHEHTWSVARAWKSPDRLVDVRRWQFDSERRVIGQMRRLVHDATSEPGIANHVATQVATWLSGDPIGSTSRE